MKAAYFSAYGQKALSGMLALIDAGPEKLDNLTQSLINSDGASANMAGTIQENLKGQVEQLGGALEILGSQFHDSVDKPMKERSLKQQATCSMT